MRHIKPFNIKGIFGITLCVTMETNAQARKELIRCKSTLVDTLLALTDDTMLQSCGKYER